MPLQHRFIETGVNYASSTIFTLESCTLGDATFASSIGAISQLGILAKFSHELFDGLSQELHGLITNVERLTQRADKLQQQFSRGKKHTQFGDEESDELKYDFSALHIESVNISSLSPETMPLRLQDVFVRSKPLLPFHELDTYMGTSQHLNHGESSKHFSDPSFFFARWKAEQDKRYDAIKEEKATKKAERKLRKKILEASARESFNRPKMLKRVSWQARYVSSW